MIEGETASHTVARGPRRDTIGVSLGQLVSDHHRVRSVVQLTGIDITAQPNLIAGDTTDVGISSLRPFFQEYRCENLAPPYFVTQAQVLGRKWLAAPNGKQG